MQISILRFPLTILLLLRLFNYTYATNSIDSLRRELPKLQGEDKAQALNQLAREFLNQNADSALHYAFRGLSLSRTINDTNKLAKAHGFIAYIQHDRGMMDKAIENYMHSVELFEESGNFLWAGYSLNNLGIVYEDIGNTEKAMECYLRALKIRRAINDPNTIWETLNNIAILYVKIEEFDKAMTYHKEAIQYAQQVENPYRLGISLGNYGIAFHKNDQPDSAIYYLKKAIHYSKIADDKENLAYCLNELGSIHLKKNINSKALENLKNALRHAESIEQKTIYSDIHNNLARLYLNEDNITKSKFHSDKAVHWAEASGDLEMKTHALFIKAKLYERTGSHSQALEVYKKYSELKDSLFNEKKVKQMSELEARYQNELKKRKILALEKLKTNQELALSREKAANQEKTIVIISLSAGSLLILAIGFILFKAYRQRQKEKEIQQQHKIEQHLNEIEKLRANIDMQLEQSPTKFNITISKDDLNNYLLQPLTQREKDVLLSVAAGKSNKEISEDLHISQNTVKYHLRNIYEKLDAKNRTEALIKADAMNIIEK